MEGILSSLLTLSEMEELKYALLHNDTPILFHGVSTVQRSFIASAVQQSTSRPLVIVCSDDSDLSRCSNDMRAISGVSPVILPCREYNLNPNATASRSLEFARLAALYEITLSPPVILTTVESLLQRTIPVDILKQAVFTLKIADSYELPELERRLITMGYARCDQIDGPGQFAVRGGILDIFSPGSEHPVRCEFFDTEIDSMGIFDLMTQRRIENINEMLILPASEVMPLRGNHSAEDIADIIETTLKKLKQNDTTMVLRQTLLRDFDSLKNRQMLSAPDRYFSLFYDSCTVLDYLKNDTIFLFHENSRITESLKGFLSLQEEDQKMAADSGFLASSFAELTLTEIQFKTKLSSFHVIELDSLLTSRSLLPPKTILSISTKQLSTYGGSLDAAASDIEQYLKSSYRVIVLCGGEVRCQNMETFLRDRGITATLNYSVSEVPEKGQVYIGIGALSCGCEFSSLSLVILTEGQITDSVMGKKRTRHVKDSNRQKLMSYTDLTPGDLVVHVHHGIGRFVGLVRMPVDGIEKDYIKISYAGSDCLYVPCTNLDLISKYIGSGDETEHPMKLNKLGGTDWAKATSKAKKAAKDLAAGLIQLYAERQRLGGHAFSPDSPWQREFEDAFDFDLTDDQFRSCQEIKEDMEKSIPMDRLLCGDVGFGKTEVALRACMKCILDGKQCAILVPTTVLAQQHYLTASNRFRSFPVTIEVLSRFKSPKECADILQRAKDGRIDLLIGTHKLLQKNVGFKDLGLLVIDEEQRFGVSHKEKLRELVKQVDTLTLSATPIPRTLNMALSGIRDMSTLEEPPLNRQVIQTYVMEHDWSMIVEAISRELRRNGQVYYLHNRVDDIESTAIKLRQRLGEDVRIAVAHGKMSEDQLSDTMQKMIAGEIDILVCTTIIETGIDIPNVNTLIIENADRMGLSQLHQIRGRIGRSSRKGYAYFTFQAGKVLTDIASKRLTAIREYVEFGAGFKIAMRDMEIRGAGNLLGPEQSGYMMSVGYDMYLKLLNDAILEEQGKGAEIRNTCTTDLCVSANIPDTYVALQEQRMDLYRRIAAIETSKDYDDIMDEMEDRFGDVPKCVKTLLDIALLRNDAKLLGIEDISQKGLQVVFSFGKSMNASAVIGVCALPSYRSRLRLQATEIPKLELFLQPKQDVLAGITKLLDDLRLSSKNTNT